MTDAEAKSLRAELARIKNTNTPEARDRVRVIRHLLAEDLHARGGSVLARIWKGG